MVRNQYRYYAISKTFQQSKVFTKIYTLLAPIFNSKQTCPPYQLSPSLQEDQQRPPGEHAPEFGNLVCPCSSPWLWRQCIFTRSSVFHTDVGYRTRRLCYIRIFAVETSEDRVYSLYLCFDSDQHFNIVVLSVCDSPIGKSLVSFTGPSPYLSHILTNSRPRWLECLQLDPRFAGSNPAEDDGLLMAIIIRCTTSFWGEGKSSIPCRKILRHFKERCGAMEDESGMNRTQMRTHNRSEMVAVLGKPCAIPLRKSNSKDTNKIFVSNL
jgi:hypothetical protein